MIPQGAGALTHQMSRGSLGEWIFDVVFTDSGLRRAVATRGCLEWTGCGQWESAGFDGSFVGDLMAVSLVIRGRMMILHA